MAIYNEFFLESLEASSTKPVEQKQRNKKGQEECRFIVRCTDHHRDRRQWWFLVCLLPRLWFQNSCRSSSTNENPQRARTTSTRLTLSKIWYTVFPEPFENANGAISIQELRMIQFHCCSGTCQPTATNQTNKQRGNEVFCIL